MSTTNINHQHYYCHLSCYSLNNILHHYRLGQSGGSTEIDPDSRSRLQIQIQIVISSAHQSCSSQWNISSPYSTSGQQPVAADSGVPWTHCVTCDSSMASAATWSLVNMTSCQLQEDVISHHCVIIESLSATDIPMSAFPCDITVSASLCDITVSAFSWDITVSVIVSHHTVHVVWHYSASVIVCHPSESAVVWHYNTRVVVCHHRDSVVIQRSVRRNRMCLNNRILRIFKVPTLD